MKSEILFCQNLYEIQLLYHVQKAVDQTMLRSMVHGSMELLYARNN